MHPSIYQYTQVFFIIISAKPRSQSFMQSFCYTTSFTAHQLNSILKKSYFFFIYHFYRRRNLYRNKKKIVSFKFMVVYENFAVSQESEKYYISFRGCSKIFNNKFLLTFDYGCFRESTKIPKETAVPIFTLFWLIRYWNDYLS